MVAVVETACRHIRPGASYSGKQGFEYLTGIAAETVGSTGICMHIAVIPPGTRGRAHLHENHESAIYVLSGQGIVWHGERLEHHDVLRQGDLFYIPAGVPHVAANLSSETLTAVIARTDPNEQESVTLLPEMDALLP
jgi:uncharacterized RmlC-like cupin family protein